MSSVRRVAERFLARTASEDEERFDDRLSAVPDIEASVENLLEALTPLADVDETPASHAKALSEAVSNAGIVETESDLDANIRDALTAAENLKKALQAAKRTVKDADLEEEARASAEEAVAEGLSLLRGIVADLKDI